MVKALDNLVAAKQLKVEPGSVEETNTLLKRAAGLLGDAGNASLGFPSRFSLAYEAAFALATAALRFSGYRADAARGHRAVVFQVLPHTLDAPPSFGPGLLRHMIGAMQSSTAPLWRPVKQRHSTY